MTRGEKILSDLSNEAPFSPPQFGSPLFSGSFLPPMCLVYFVSPRREREKKASRSKMIAIFWNSAKRTTPITHNVH